MSCSAHLFTFSVLQRFRTNTATRFRGVSNFFTEPHSCRPPCSANAMVLQRRHGTCSIAGSHFRRAVINGNTLGDANWACFSGGGDWCLGHLRSGTDNRGDRFVREHRPPCARLSVPGSGGIECGPECRRFDPGASARIRSVRPSCCHFVCTPLDWRSTGIAFQNFFARQKPGKLRKFVTPPTYGVGVYASPAIDGECA
jgi:hypothetical protein